MAGTVRDLANSTTASTTVTAETIAPTNVTSNEILKIGSVRAAVDGLTLAGTVGGKTCNLTVDTGSSISIVRPDKLDNLNVVQPSSHCLRTVTGDTAPLRGCGELEVGVGSLVIPHEMWVANIADECILGLDFLQKHGCQLFLKEGILIIGDQEVPLAKPTRSAALSCSRVIAQESRTVAPQAEAVIPGQLAGNIGEARWAIIVDQGPELQGSLNGGGGLLVARCLVNLEKQVLPVRFFNPTQYSYRVCKVQTWAAVNLS